MSPARNNMSIIHSTKNTQIITSNKRKNQRNKEPYSNNKKLWRTSAVAGSELLDLNTQVTDNIRQNINNDLDGLQSIFYKQKMQPGRSSQKNNNARNNDNRAGQAKKVIDYVQQMQNSQPVNQQLSSVQKLYKSTINSPKKSKQIGCH